MQKDPAEFLTNPPAQGQAGVLRKIGSETPEETPQVNVTFRMKREEKESSLPIGGREELESTQITGGWQIVLQVLCSSPRAQQQATAPAPLADYAP